MSAVLGAAWMVAGFRLEAAAVGALGGGFDRLVFVAAGWGAVGDGFDERVSVAVRVVAAGAGSDRPAVGVWAVVTTAMTRAATRAMGAAPARIPRPSNDRCCGRPADPAWTDAGAGDGRLAGPVSTRVAPVTTLVGAAYVDPVRRLSTSSAD
jgi:hypothetical protein